MRPLGQFRPHQKLHSSRASRLGAAAATTALIVGLGVGLAAPASAAEPDGPWSKSDPAGDAPAPVDITRGATHWEGKRIIARVDVRDLGKSGRFRVSLVDDGETIHLFVKKQGKKITKKVQNFNFEGKHQNLPCKGITVDWNAGKDYITVTAPLASCVDSGPWGTDGMWLKGPGGAVDKVGTIWWTGD